MGRWRNRRRRSWTRCRKRNPKRASPYCLDPALLYPALSPSLPLSPSFTLALPLSRFLFPSLSHTNLLVRKVAKAAAEELDTLRKMEPETSITLNSRTFTPQPSPVHTVEYALFNKSQLASRYSPGGEGSGGGVRHAAENGCRRPCCRGTALALPPALCLSLLLSAFLSLALHLPPCFIFLYSCGKIPPPTLLPRCEP